MVTTLYLIRHGETAGDGVKRYKGSIDVPLSEAGIVGMRRSAGFIREHLELAGPSKRSSYLRDIHEPGAVPGEETAGLSRVYTSDLSRAIKSAEIIAAPYSATPVQIPALRERSFGIWEGMSFVEIKEKYPEEFAAWAGNPLEHSPVGGESTIAVRDRVLPALEKILEESKGKDIAVVAHGGVNRIMLCHFLGVPLENIFRIEQDYSAVNIIELWDKYPVVKLMNGGTVK